MEARHRVSGDRGLLSTIAAFAVALPAIWTRLSFGAFHSFAEAGLFVARRREQASVDRASHWQVCARFQIQAGFGLRHTQENTSAEAATRLIAEF